jgi:competence protein ComER
MLTKAFARAAIANVEIVAFNRTPAKLDKIVLEYPAVQKMDSAASLGKTSQVIFLCVKPGDVQTVLNSLQPCLTRDQFLVSINSVWSIADLEQAAPCKVVKLIPSITQESLSGAILTMYGSRLTHADLELMNSLLQAISFPIAIDEQQTRVSSDLTSCGPAFMSHVLQSFATAAERQGNLSREQADILVKTMIYGLAKLIVEEGFSFHDVIKRVAVPGGVTAEGLKVLEPALDGVFDRVLTATRLKQTEHETHK